MTIIQATILGLVQGLTEFIPVSSSGHLLLVQHAMGLGASGFSFDVALHVGTLLALVLFFYKDLGQLAVGLVKKTNQSKLSWLLVLATIPAVVSGFLLESAAESRFRSVVLVSINLIVVALLMIAAERYGQKIKTHTKLNQVNRSQALTMGLAQAAAIVPGVSRSGATITAGLFSGLDRLSATRFSFLLGIPITFGAAAKVLLGESARSDIAANPGIFIFGMAAAALSGLFAIRFMLRYLANHNLNIFAYYRIALGLVVIVLVSAL